MRASRRELLQTSAAGLGALAVLNMVADPATADENKQDRASIVIDNIGNGDTIGRTFSVVGTYDTRKRVLQSISCALLDAGGSQIVSGAVTISTSPRTWIADFEDVPNPPTDGTPDLKLLATINVTDPAGSNTAEKTGLRLEGNPVEGPGVIILTPQPPGRSGIPNMPKLEILSDLDEVSSRYVESGKGVGGTAYASNFSLIASESGDFE